ncbi:MAG: hypothetical protein ABSA46_08170 [Thermodesulfovibrionales bacterium]
MNRQERVATQRAFSADSRREGVYTIGSTGNKADHVYVNGCRTSEVLTPSHVQNVQGHIGRKTAVVSSALNRALWRSTSENASSFVETSGHILEETIKKYIEEQKGDRNVPHRQTPDDSGCEGRSPALGRLPGLPGHLEHPERGQKGQSQPGACRTWSNPPMPRGGCFSSGDARATEIERNINSALNDLKEPPVQGPDALACTSIAGYSLSPTSGKCGLSS